MWMIFFFISLIINVVGAIFFVRYLKRLFQYDELFYLMQNDINANLESLDGLVKSPLLSNSPEVLNLAKLMKLMQDNLRRYALSIEENTFRSNVNS